MQLHLFPSILNQIELEAPDSPRRAFYRLAIEECQGIYTVVKESGAGGKVLDVRRWQYESMNRALKKYDKLLTDKLNPQRKSPRKYKRKRLAKQAVIGKYKHSNLKIPYQCVNL